MSNSLFVFDLISFHKNLPTIIPLVHLLRKVTRKTKFFFLDTAIKKFGIDYLSTLYLVKWILIYSLLHLYLLWWPQTMMNQRFLWSKVLITSIILAPLPGGLFQHLPCMLRQTQGVLYFPYISTFSDMFLSASLERMS